MRGPIEYSDELHPSSSHRTPGEIAADEIGPIGGFPDRTLMDEQARLLEESLEYQAAPQARRVNLLRAYSSTNTFLSAYRRQEKENP